MSCAPPPLSELRGKSLLIFDDSLMSKDGHWFEIDKAIAELHVGLGVETTIVCNSSFAFADELRATGATVLPLIAHTVWSGEMNGGRGLLNEFKVLFKLARHFRSVLATVLREKTFDCVVHPSAMAADVFAWSLLPRRMRRRAGRVALLTRFGLGSYSAAQPPRFARKLIYWRWLMRVLTREFTSGRFVLVTDSVRLADEYATVSGVRPDVLCSPRAMAEAPVPEVRPHALTFGALGFARREKGSHLIQIALENLIADRHLGDLRFVIQWNRRPLNDDGTELRRSPALEAHPQIEYLDNALSSADYERTLHSIDCMVLPYRRALYHSQISGVAVEAACAGIPMIYTADTWLSDFVGEQGAGIAVADGDAEGLAQAILAMAADYPAYKALAVERSAIARARNSPEAFARVLWGASPNARVAGSAP